MADKNSVSDWSETAIDNDNIGGISLQENVMRPPAVNNAFREMMKQIRSFFPLSFAFGGTGTTTVAGARTALGIAWETVPNGIVAVQTDQEQVDFTGLGAYRELRLKLAHIEPSVNASSLMIRVSVGGNFNSTAGAYRVQNSRAYGSVTDANRNISSATGFALSGAVGSGATGGVSAVCYFDEFNQNRNIFMTSTGGYISDLNEEITYNTMQRFVGTSSRDGLRVKFSSGNIVAGSRLILEGIVG